jgi:hypothetical protein
VSERSGGTVKHLTLALLLAAPAVAVAQSAPDAEEVVDEAGRKRAVKYRDREEVDFERGLELEGELLKPSITPIDELRRPVFNPLIHLREHWTEEMRSSVAEIR